MVIYAYISLNEYMYRHSLKIPAKYHDKRLDISNVRSFFP